MIEETKKLIVRTNDHLLINLDIYGAFIKQQLMLTNDFVTNFDPRTAGTTFYSNIIASAGCENPEVMGYMGLTDDNYDLENIFTDDLKQHSYRAIFLSLYSVFEVSLGVDVETTSGFANLRTLETNNNNGNLSKIKRHHCRIKERIAPSIGLADFDKVFKEIDENIRPIRNHCIHDSTFDLVTTGCGNKTLMDIIDEINGSGKFIKTLRHCCKECSQNCKECSEEKLEKVGNCFHCRYDIVMLDGFIEHTLQLMTCYATMLNAHLKNKTYVRDNN